MNHIICENFNHKESLTKKIVKKSNNYKKVCRYYYEFGGVKDGKQGKNRESAILSAGGKGTAII